MLWQQLLSCQSLETFWYVEMLNKSCVNIYQNPAVTVDIMKTFPQVVLAVLCYRTLRQPPNLLLLALAVTDLCVSVVVMPGNN